jgi:hypothetical protein
VTIGASLTLFAAYEQAHQRPLKKRSEKPLLQVMAVWWSAMLACLFSILIFNTTYDCIWLALIIFTEHRYEFSWMHVWETLPGTIILGYSI